MKKTFIFLFCFIYFKSFAQSYKTEYLSINALHYPTYIQNKEVNNYTLKLDVPANDSYYGTLVLPNLRNSFQLNAFSEVFSDGKNGIEIAIASMVNIKTAINEIKASPPNSSSYNYTLYGEIPYRIKIYDEKGKSFYFRDFDNKIPINYKSESFNTYTDALNFYSPGKPGFAALRSYLQNQISLIVKGNILSMVQNAIDYYPTKYNENFYTFKTNKKENFDDWNKTLEELKIALEKITPKTDRKDFNEASKKVKSFYISKLKNLDPLNKDQENQFTAAALNLATIYYWGDMSDSTLFYLAEARKVKDKTNEINNLEKSVEAKNTRVEKLKAADIEYYIGLTKPNGSQITNNQNIVSSIPNQISQDEYFNNMLKDSKNFLESEGSITPINGQKISTTFKKFKNFNEAELSQYSNQTFYVYNGKLVKLFTQPLAGYELDGINYEQLEFYSSTEVGLAVKGFATLTFSSDKIKVYEYDTKDANNLAGQFNILYKKPDERIATNTSSIKFLLFYKKSLSKYFEDCPSVSEKASKGGCTKNLSGFTAAAKEYAACK